MSKRSVLALLVVLALSVVSPVAAEEFVVKNDSIADINQAVAVADFLAGEHAGVRLTSPTDGIIVAVQILWLGSISGDLPRFEQAIRIYDEGTFPTPGTQLAEIENPFMVADGWNEFRHLDSDKTVPLSIQVDSGQSFYITLEFANPTSGKASVVRDSDGCQAGRNVVYLPTSWYNLCLLGAPGDFVIRAVIDSGPVCFVKLLGDINGDCYVNLLDMAELAKNWLGCNNLMDSNCF